MNRIEMEQIGHYLQPVSSQPVFNTYESPFIPHRYEEEYFQLERITPQSVSSPPYSLSSQPELIRQFSKLSSFQDTLFPQHNVVLTISREELRNEIHTPQLPSSANKIFAQSPLKFNTSIKSKLFKQVSNKENQAEDSAASKAKYVSKTSIKKEATPVKIEFESQSAKKRPIVAPFKLPEVEAVRSKETSLQSSKSSAVNKIQITPIITSLPQIAITDFVTTQSSEVNPNTTTSFLLETTIQSEQLLAKYSKDTRFLFEEYSYESIRPSLSIDQEWKQRPSFSLLDYTVTDILDVRSPRNSIDYSLQSFSFFPEIQKQITAVPYLQQVSFMEEIQSFWDSNTSIQQSTSTQSNPKPNPTFQNPKLSDFTKGKRLGKGMFGQVFVVQHNTTGFICAMKILSKQFVRTQKVTDQLIQELKIHMFLSHPNIVSVYGFFSDQQNVYILQELCAGGQLFDILVKRRRISEKKTAYYVNQMLQGLGYIHSEQVIHRDIKPENILLQFGVVKIGDFGWAAYSPANQYSDKCGTPLYYSPEIIRGQKYSRIADNWGVGLICYQLIVGNIPWSIWTQQEINRIAEQDLVFPNFLEVSNTAQDFIERVLTKYPGNRLSIEEMSAHDFLIGTSVFDYHNEARTNYGEATP